MTIEVIHAKLARAQEHVDAFNEERQEWIQSQSSGLNDQWVNEYTQSFTVHGLGQPPIRLSILIGDFAHNVRSALDHLIFDLWLSHSGRPSDAEMRRIQMPIELTRESFDSARQRALSGPQSDGKCPSGLRLRDSLDRDAHPIFLGFIRSGWEPSVEVPVWAARSGHAECVCPPNHRRTRPAA